MGWFERRRAAKRAQAAEAAVTEREALKGVVTFLGGLTMDAVNAEIDAWREDLGHFSRAALDYLDVRLVGVFGDPAEVAAGQRFAVETVLLVTIENDRPLRLAAVNARLAEYAEFIDGVGLRAEVDAHIAKVYAEWATALRTDAERALFEDNDRRGLV